MENDLESFLLLEKRTLALGQRYREVLEERSRLQQVVEEQSQALAKLEAEISQQNELFTEVDTKMVGLLRQIDNFLPDEGSPPGEELSNLRNEQILPGMHGN
ncbi:MAG: hypothetical protein J7M09_00030 [Deltaproteobacteria bacterium]|nr:hypothetical protein [Candidatus Tharpella sp.]